MWSISVATQTIPCFCKEVLTPDQKAQKGRHHSVKSAVRVRKMAGGGGGGAPSIPVGIGVHHHFQRTIPTNTAMKKSEIINMMMPNIHSSLVIIMATAQCRAVIA
eukprot:TRINITY_DN61904_c0_g1_i2.p1 TRINITY_DN61904_c0_g1~~TRINITY_DN61904_c0_g1_i2.p1  ORF type:complete len:105 (+),score=3.04 TRINITY_DN61904_c0_g1_i2:174-488(+)